MAIKPYSPIFTESKQKSKKQILESAKKTILGIKKKVKKMREEAEDETPMDMVDAISDVVDALDDVIADSIDTLGVADPVTDALIDAAKDVDLQADIAEDNPEMYESKIKKPVKK
jgi:hypothetical protein